MSQIDSRHPGGDYTCALSELHRLLLNYRSAASFLRQASALTARTVGTGLSCSIMLQSGGHALAVATSDPLATLAEQVQESTGQGPSLRCLRWRHVVQINDLAADARWPLFALRAAEVGVRSCLCLPLEAPGATAALSLYAPAPHAFGPPQTERASTFAGYLAGALIIGARQDGLLATIDQLRSALTSRAVIDQAVGVIITRERCSSGQAVAKLRAESQHRNIKLRGLARQIVAEASGRPPQPPSFELGPQAAGTPLAPRRERAAAGTMGPGAMANLSHCPDGSAASPVHDSPAGPQIRQGRGAREAAQRE